MPHGVSQLVNTSEAIFTKQDIHISTYSLKATFIKGYDRAALLGGGASYHLKSKEDFLLALTYSVTGANRYPQLETLLAALLPFLREEDRNRGHAPRAKDSTANDGPAASGEK